MNRFQLRRIGLANGDISARPNLSDCVRSVIEVADGLMLDVLDGLAKLSSDSRSGSALACPTHLSKEMADVLLCQARSVSETFVSQLELAIQSSHMLDWADRSTTRFEDLQMLNSEQINDSIEFALALQDVSRCVEDVLPSVNSFISSLAGWTTVQPSLNPLKAEVFVQALMLSLRRHVPDPKVRAALFTPSAGLLGVALRQLYRELCDWLRLQYIEPSWPVGRRLGSGDLSPAGGVGNPINRAMWILDKFRRLLSIESIMACSGSVRQDFLPTVPSSYMALEDLNLIKPMMQRLAHRESHRVEGAVTEGLVGKGMTVGQFRAKQLSRQLGGEVLCLMLDSVLQDQRLVPGVRVLIKRLEPALQDLVRSDPRFFTDRQHPARQFLEWLSRRSLVFGSDNDEGLNGFLAAGTDAVNLIDQERGGAPLFAKVLQQLSSVRPQGLVPC